MKSTLNTTIKRKGETLAAVKCLLREAGLRPAGRDTWKRRTKGAVMTIAMVDENSLTMRGEWQDHDSCDVLFFDFGDTTGLVSSRLSTLASWMAWYTDGNRVTQQGTIGYEHAVGVAR